MNPLPSLSRSTAALAAGVLLTTGLGVVATAGAAPAAPAASAASVASGASARADLPATVHLDLPDGFQPEGIATDARGKYAYLGSRVDGDIVRLELATGALTVLAQGPGTQSLGLKVDDANKRIFVAGGSGGDVRVLNQGNGNLQRSYTLVPAGTPSFINDVVLTDQAAYFTDSANAQLFALPLGPDGHLPRRSEVRRIPLGGDWVQVAGNNANGITATPNGRALLVVNSTSGLLYRVNPRNGKATVVDLGGVSLANGDGLLLENRTLYAVRNRDNAISVITLKRNGRSGVLREVLTDPDLDVPSTVARAGERLYLPNARFTTPATPTTPYWVTGIGVPDRRSPR